MLIAYLTSHFFFFFFGGRSDKLLGRIFLHFIMNNNFDNAKVMNYYIYIYIK